MADASSPEDAAAARAAEQARLRKQKREAKIKAGGTARLNKITGLGGGFQRDAPAPTPVTAPQPTTTTTNEAAADPEEVDISQHFYSPNVTPRFPTSGVPSPSPAAANANPSAEAQQLRQMMLGLDPSSSSSGSGPGTPGGGAFNPFMAGAGAGAGGPTPTPPQMMPGMEGMENDPMMKMLTQMMGAGGAGGMPGADGSGGGANPFAGMESLFGGAAGGMPGMPPNPMMQAQQAVADRSANLWRILHAVFALGLGLYVALATTFTGTKAERDHSTLDSSGFLGKIFGGSGGLDDIEQHKAYFFYLFSSIEALLLTSRFFLDKNRAPPGGMIWTISGFLPHPFKGYVQHAMRYSQIFSTVRSDALVCVFVLGACCWLRS